MHWKAEKFKIWFSSQSYHSLRIIRWVKLCHIAWKLQKYFCTLPRVPTIALRFKYFTPQEPPPLSLSLSLSTYCPPVWGADVSRIGTVKINEPPLSPPPLFLSHSMFAACQCVLIELLQQISLSLSHTVPGRFIEFLKCVSAMQWRLFQWNFSKSKEAYTPTPRSPLHLWGGGPGGGGGCLVECFGPFKAFVVV